MWRGYKQIYEVTNEEVTQAIKNRSGLHDSWPDPRVGSGRVGSGRVESENLQKKAGPVRPEA